MSGYEGLLTFCTPLTITWKNISLRASFPGRSPAWREKEGQLATTSLELEFHPQLPCGSPSTKLSDFRQLARSGNECECEQILKGNDVITNVISANRHFVSTFSMKIFKFRRRSCKLSFLFPPRRQSAPRTCSQAVLYYVEEPKLMRFCVLISRCTFFHMILLMRIKGFRTKKGKKMTMDCCSNEYRNI